MPINRMAGLVAGPLCTGHGGFHGSPFVGMFIARVSKGRTIREFIVGVLLIPTGFTMIWMGFMGNAALYSILHEANHSLVLAVQRDSSVALF